MSRIADAFAGAAGPLLVPYLTAGWPQPGDTAELLAALDAGGADIIEIGVPFSDPVADGPVIQRANEEALAGGASLQTALDAVAQYRAAGGTKPVVAMGYANPFLRMGLAELAGACRESGVDGVLAVDWPPTVDDALGAALGGAGIDRVALVAPATSAARVAQIAARTTGYIYYVSLQGVTGSKAMDREATIAAGRRLREATGLPVAVGFGVRSAEDCAQLGAAFDAVIVGTRLLEEIRAAAAAGADKVEAARKLVAELAAGCR